MQKTKSFVALFIVFYMLVSMFAFSFNVSAEETAENIVALSEDEKMLVEKMELLGLVSNEYDPAAFVTRREMANIICTYMALPANSSTSTTTPFRDVSVKDADFSKICAIYDLGVISGDGNLRFYPDENVTYDEALVFIINAIGHKIFAQRNSGYPTGYYRTAISYGMLEDLNIVSGKDDVRLVDVYKMMDAALDAATVITSYNGDGSETYTLSKTDTFLYTNHSIRKYQGVVTGNEYTRLTSSDNRMKSNQIEINGTLYDVLDNKYSNLLGYNVEYYVREYSDGEEIIYIDKSEKKNYSIKIDAEHILHHLTTLDRVYYTEENNDKEHHITFTAIPDVIYNDQYYRGYGDLASALPQKGYIEALDNDNNGIYDVLFVYEYVNYVVSAIDNYNYIITDEITGDKIALDEEQNDVFIKVMGETKQARFADILIGDVISVLASKDANPVITVYISRNVTTGKITESNVQEGYLINNTFYHAATEYADTPLTVGLSGKFYLDMNNDIVKYSYDSKTEQYNVGVVQALDYKISNLSSTVTVRIFTDKGEFTEYKLLDNVKVNGRKYDITEADECETVLSIISKGNIDAETSLYKVNKVYVAKYVPVGENSLASIDTGDVGGEGMLNVIADGWKHMLVRENYMLVLGKDTMTANMVTQYNYDDGIVFHIPNDIDNLNAYRKTKSLQTNHYYSALRSDYSRITEFSLYTTKNSQIPTGNILLLHGTGSASSGFSANTSIGVVTQITDGLDKDDMPTKKLYMSNGGTYTLANEVTVTRRNGTGSGATVSQNVPVETLVASPAKLKPGVVLQLGLDDYGDVTEIRFISEYDSVSDTILPLFASSGSCVYESVDLGFAGEKESFVVAEILETDVELKLLKVKIGTSKESLVYVTENTECVVYITDKDMTIMDSVENITAGDKVVLRLGGYFEVQQIIVFR